LRIEQHELLERRLQGMLTAPRPEFLATGDERLTAARLAEIKSGLEGDASPAAAALRQRVERLEGVLTFTLRTEYHDRLDVFARHLRDLRTAIESLRAEHTEFVRTRQAAVHSFEGYDASIGRLRTRVAEALGEVNLLMARQGRVLELVAIDELVARRDRLEEYRDQARFALADSYDRATSERADAEIAALQPTGAEP
jgi:chromosome segregation ATPase